MLENSSTRASINGWSIDHVGVFFCFTKPSGRTDDRAEHAIGSPTKNASQK